MDGLREKILEHGLGVASARGLHALSIGDLARELELSRSGLFSKFSNKESLQLAVLEQAAAVFVKDVMDTTGADLPGAHRVRTLFAKWVTWGRSPRFKGGCPFVQASAESATLPDPVRRKLKAFLDGWSEVLGRAIDDAKEAGDFKAGLDTDQLVFELYGLYLSHHYWHWSMKDKNAHERTLRAFERLMQTAQV